LKKIDVQFIKGRDGEPEFAVIPYLDYLAMVERKQSRIPHAVVRIMVEQECSLMAAWRHHRKLSQSDLAKALGTSQSAVAQTESVTSRPQKATREVWASILACDPDQLISS
jgi:Helix-turn-helix.